MTLLIPKEFTLIEGGEEYKAGDINASNFKKKPSPAACPRDLEMSPCAPIPGSCGQAAGRRDKEKLLSTAAFGWDMCLVKDLPTNQPYLVLDYTTFDHQSPLVLHIIYNLFKAQACNIPLILNRTGEKIEEGSLPKTFSIGLFTSGTTGPPKLIFHHLGNILPKNTKKTGHSTWLLSYHPMSFAGLQVILQALVCGDTLVAAAYSNLQEKAELALKHAITALSATPSLIRALLLYWQKDKPKLTIVTCGGELCDQKTLDVIKDAFPQAKIACIYATTETGVLFTVRDEKAGFPSRYLNEIHNNSHLSIKNDELMVITADKTIATGDGVILKDNRVLFTGRIDHIINIGGVKVNIEHLESLLLQLSSIYNARVYSKPNPITGAIVCAEIQSKDEEQTRAEIALLNKTLNPAEQLRVIRFVQYITLSDAGKKIRADKT